LRLESFPAGNYRRGKGPNIYKQVRSRLVVLADQTGGRCLIKQV
jgi:hypothetical protein